MGQRIREIRLSKGLTQTELAFKCNDKDYSQINRVELGKVNFSVSYLSLIASALDVNPNELIWFIHYILIDILSSPIVETAGEFINEHAREVGKTRGAIGFALIFLCFVSLYQDKEMKKKDKWKRMTKFPIKGSRGLVFGVPLRGFGIWDLELVIMKTINHQSQIIIQNARSDRVCLDFSLGFQARSETVANRQRNEEERQKKWNDKIYSIALFWRINLFS